ncbi:MAG: hypothetical protein RBT36_08625 [Desulfobulbus sp.]|jgi:hypothetical protein|nr:hypothetical protein [Desulfobulbus sp.]
MKKKKNGVWAIVEARKTKKHGRPFRSIKKAEDVAYMTTRNRPEDHYMALRKILTENEGRSLKWQLLTTASTRLTFVTFCAFALRAAQKAPRRFAS